MAERLSAERGLDDHFWRIAGFGLMLVRREVADADGWAFAEDFETVAEHPASDGVAMQTVTTTVSTDAQPQGRAVHGFRTAFPVVGSNVHKSGRTMTRMASM